MPQFGTEIDPGVVVEVTDPSGFTDDDGNTRTLRPPAGTQLPVKDATTGDPLEDPIVLAEDGQWSYTTSDTAQILINVTPGGPGEKWVGPIWSKEARDNAAAAGDNASAALVVAQQALVTAQAASTGGGGGSGPAFERILEVPGSPGTYPSPTTSGPRWFFGQFEPTTDDGFRDVSFGDMWWPVVVTS